MVSTDSGVISKGGEDGFIKVIRNMNRESVHMPGIVVPNAVKLGAILVKRKRALDEVSVGGGDVRQPSI